MPEVFDECGRVSLAGMPDLILGIQQVVPMDASVRVDEVDGFALVIVGRFEHVRAIGHVIQLVDELEAALKQRIEIGGEDRPAERRSPSPRLLRFEDAGQEDVCAVDLGMASLDRLAQVLAAHLVVQ
ncbi:MAG TPA: hypothetical protein VGA84_06775 [Thermoanaerobaculia bacterium]